MKGFDIFENLVMFSYAAGCSLLFRTTIQRSIFCKTMQHLIFVKPCNVCFLCKRLQSSVLENHATFYFFAKQCTVLFLAKGICLPFGKTMQGVCFFKTVQCFFLTKGCSIPFCKTMQCLISKIEECFFSLANRGNFLLSELCTVSLAHLHRASMVTASECFHAPVVKILKAMRKLMNTNVYLAESVWLCTIDDCA